MPRTGERCTIAGIYECSVHAAHQITMPEGHVFPPCEKHGEPGHGASWELVRKTKH